MFVNRSKRNEQSLLKKNFHRCFLPSFGTFGPGVLEENSFGQVVSEEKIFRNRSITNKNCLWPPCLLTDRDKMCILYREPFIDASYQALVNLVQGFQRRRLKYEKLMDDRWRTIDEKRQVIAKAHLAFGYITGNDLTGTGNDREIISHVLYPYFPRCCPELL